MNKIKFLLISIFIISNSTIKSEWKKIETQDIGDVQSISCPDSNNCFTLVNHTSTPVLYKSIDQGMNWKLIYEDNKTINPSVEEGQSPNPNYYFIADYYYSKIEKSTDGGITFKTILLDDSDFGPEWTLEDLAMWDTLRGFATNGYYYFTTTDGWETFEKHPKLNTDQTYYSPVFFDSNTVAMSYVANIRWNDNKGFAFVKFHLNENKWDTISYFGRDSNNWIDAIKNLCFINDTLGFGCGTRNTDEHNGQYYDIIYRTTNGGKNWELIHKEFIYPYKGFYNNISFADEKNGIAVGFYGKIAMTNDGGETWVYEPTPNEMDNCRKMLVCWAGQTPLIGTWDAGIFRYEGDFFDFPISVEDEPEESGISVYPNPATEYIEINVGAIHELSLQEIRIYNAFGQCVMNLGAVLEPAPTRRIDISDLPSGIYFVKIRGFFKKFIIFK
jgi:hypothetical protein